MRPGGDESEDLFQLTVFGRPASPGTGAPWRAIRFGCSRVPVVGLRIGGRPADELSRRPAGQRMVYAHNDDVDRREEWLKKIDGVLQS